MIKNSKFSSDKKVDMSQEHLVLLNGFFEFPNMVQSNLQSSSSVLNVLNLFLAMLKQKGEDLLDSGVKFSSLHQVVKGLSEGFDKCNMDKDYFVNWFGDFGCALVGRKCRFNKFKLTLVFLDGWVSSVANADKRFVSVNASPSGSNCFEFGEHSKDDCIKVITNLHQLISASLVTKKGGKPQLARTPSFIRYLIMNIFNGQTDLKIEGTTDVGNHDKCTPKTTAFGLVVNVIQNLAKMTEIELYLLMVHFSFYSFNLYVKIQSSVWPKEAINNLSIILKRAA
ncbi:hypothetical protein ROZALSC1DRAFT_25791, partial [Rozella allomycis CSF55]